MSVDWSEHDRWPEDTCYCECGGIWLSHSRWITKNKLVTRKACPMCKKNDNLKRASVQKNTLDVMPTDIVTELAHEVFDYYDPPGDDERPTEPPPLPKEDDSDVQAELKSMERAIWASFYASSYPPTALETDEQRRQKELEDKERLLESQLEKMKK